MEFSYLQMTLLKGGIFALPRGFTYHIHLKIEVSYALRYLFELLKILANRHNRIAFVKKSLIFHNLTLISRVDRPQIIVKQVGKGFGWCLVGILDVQNLLEVVPMLAFIGIRVR